MLSSIVGWFKHKSAVDIFDPKKEVKIHGIKFKIRKLNPLDHMVGANVLRKIYDTYQAKSAPVIDDNGVSKVKQHYMETFMCGVVEVKIFGKWMQLTRKGEEGKLPVEHLLTDWELAEQLYVAISEHTYGKKKLWSAYRVKN